MTSKTSILLIVSQNPGIDYQALLSKIAPNYANLNSARAALSRVLKDAVSFGMVAKQNHQLFLTDKGQASLKVKMHDKLVLKLNQIMNVRSVASNPDPLVQHLSVLLERGKIDPRLLDNARASVNFSVDELHRVHEGVKQNIKHMEYLEKTLGNQLLQLRELNFPSERIKHVQNVSHHIPKLVELSSAEEVQLEHPEMDLAQQLNHSLLEGFSPQARGTRAAIHSKHLHDVVTRLSNQSDARALRAYLGLFTLDFSNDTVSIRGPSQLLDKLGLESDETNKKETNEPILTRKAKTQHVPSMDVAFPLPELPFPSRDHSK